MTYNRTYLGQRLLYNKMVLQDRWSFYTGSKCMSPPTNCAVAYQVIQSGCMRRL